MLKRPRWVQDFSARLWGGVGLRLNRKVLLGVLVSCWIVLSWLYQLPLRAQIIDPGNGQVNVFLPIASTNAEPTPTPTAAVSVAAPQAQARFALVNLQMGPDATFGPSGQITPRDACEIVGRNLAANYWFLECDSGAHGWIDSRFVIVTGATQNVPVIQVVVMEATPGPPPNPTALPTATPIPPPLPTPNLARGWAASFYNNTGLGGEPAAVDDLPDVNFNWGAGSPNPRINVDNFSARFERRFSLPRGYHRFELRADDGVRFWLNDQLLIDGWNHSDNSIYITGAQLAAGVYDFRIEYFEGGGNAYIQFFYDFLGTDTDWQATYYDNAGLRGNPVLSQSEPSRRDPLEFSIGASSPLYQPRIGTKWSARWQGNFYFWGGDYTFRAQATGGVRVYIDGLLVLDGWNDSQKDINNVFRQVGQGEHAIKVEYYHQTGDSSLRVWWYLRQNNIGPF
ncbi:MAG: PA14 domain-containing protein [Caldilineaceae bacterium]